MTFILLRRFWAWLLANPLVGIVGAAVAYIGVTRLRMQHLENKASRAQAQADAARMEMAERESKQKADAHRADIDARRAEAEDAITQENKGHAMAEDAHDTLTRIGKKWPTR